MHEVVTRRRRIPKRRWLMRCNISTLTPELNGRAKGFRGCRVLLLSAIWPPPFKQLSIFSFSSTESWHHTEKEALRYHIAHHFCPAMTPARRILPEREEHCQRGGICPRTCSFPAGFDSKIKHITLTMPMEMLNSIKNKNNLHVRKAGDLRCFLVGLIHVVRSQGWS